MTAARDGWITCETCRGSGGPPSRFDDELGRWEHYVCRSCGGSGGWRDPWPDLPRRVAS